MTGRPLPYGRQDIDQTDIDAVVEVLRGDWLTTGPAVPAFEKALALSLDLVMPGAVVACANGTAALHLAHMGLGIGPGWRVVVPSLTFTACAAAGHLVGAEVVLADVDPESGLLTADSFSKALEGLPAGAPKAVVAVHLNGQAVDMAALAPLAREAGCVVIEDACHALGSRLGADAVGNCRHSTVACFSFHPVKTLTTGEGGALSTADPELAASCARLRHHGIERDAECFFEKSPGPWYHEIQALGLNYRLSDIQAALGLSQLRRLPRFIGRRRDLVEIYDDLLRPHAPLIRPVRRLPDQSPAWHLYSVLIDYAALGKTRAEVMRALLEAGIGSQVHYIPLHLQPYYRERYGPLSLPGAEAYYARQLSLPLFPAMSDSDPERVVQELIRALGL